MPQHTERVQTPARVSRLAEELRAMAETLDRASVAMSALGIKEMPLPRANAESVGIASVQAFADATRDVLRQVGLEVANGLSVDEAIEKVLSVYREGPRKRRQKSPTKSKRKTKTDSDNDDVTPKRAAS